MAVQEVFFPILNFVRAEIIVNTFVVLIVLLVVGLRIVGRLIGPGCGLDDWMIVVATPLGVAMLVFQGLFATTGNGWPLPKHPELASNIPYILELTFIMQTLYVTLLASVKASMLFFFLRIFPSAFMKRASYTLLGAVFLWWVSYLSACIFLCNPVSAQWTSQGKCGLYLPMIQSLIATNAVGDLVIMAVPMKSIWKLQTRRTDKIGIISCFSLCLACVVCAVFRLIYISTVDLNGNITGTMPTTIFLFVLEPNLAILCVSIPMLRPFYAKYRRRMGGTSRLDDSSQKNSSAGVGHSKYAGRAGLGGKGKNTPADAGTLSSWEMEDYYGGGHKNETVATAYGGDDGSGSEKNLTVVPTSPVPKGMIGVEIKISAKNESRYE
ncbi:hypothetical protein LZ554_000996 [Drepanopeziza brunnea f. sp. 'monogermtubi']|nr:hypothetical protein LZ554_000996 [Drepanopeziza brunnea f. sp. 'monogermtubi']